MYHQRLDLCVALCLSVWEIRTSGKSNALDLFRISSDLRTGAPPARHCRASPAALGVGFGHQAVPCKLRTVRTVAMLLPFWKRLLRVHCMRRLRGVDFGHQKHPLTRVVCYVSGLGLDEIEAVFGRKPMCCCPIGTVCCVRLPMYPQRSDLCVALCLSV